MDTGQLVEQWRPVKGYEGSYEISDQGRVRSTMVNPQGRIRTPAINSRGYLHLTLQKNGEPRTFKIHQLVLEAFVGPRPPGYECCHANDIKTDNRLDNLRWDTSSANKYERLRNGKHPDAHRTHCKRGHELTPENITIMHNGQTRACRECRRLSYQQRKERNREPSSKAPSPSQQQCTLPDNHPDPSHLRQNRTGVRW